METTTSPIEPQQTATAAVAVEAPASAPEATSPEMGQPAQQAAAPAQGVEAPGKLDDDGVALDDDGELLFGDKFFDTYREDFGAPQGGQEPEQKEDGPANAAPSPAFYTVDELKAFESVDQIDPARFPEAMQPYLPVIRDYVLGLQRQVGLLRSMEASRSAPRPQTQAPQAPRPMEHKEIAALARKVAAERLGVKPEDLDTYDPEHVAALGMAVQDIAARNRAEVAAWQGQAQAQQDLQRFAVDLASQPDFQQFDAWVTGRLASAGMSADQLLVYVQQTGDLAGVQRAVTEMYREWKSQGAQAPQGAQPQSPQQQKPQGAVLPKVPVVESANGAAQGRKTVDLRGFGDMDDDSQARALIEMGLV
mgnify:CR=1 FL=1